MAERRWYKCNNCKFAFETEVLSPEEARRMRERGQPTSAVHCPQCNRTDLRPGRE